MAAIHMRTDVLAASSNHRVCDALLRELAEAYQEAQAFEGGVSENKSGWIPNEAQRKVEGYLIATRHLPDTRPDPQPDPEAEQEPLVEPPPVVKRPKNPWDRLVKGLARRRRKRPSCPSHDNAASPHQIKTSLSNLWVPGRKKNARAPKQVWSSDLSTHSYVPSSPSSSRSTTSSRTLDTVIEEDEGDHGAPSTKDERPGNSFTYKKTRRYSDGAIKPIPNSFLEPQYTCPKRARRMTVNSPYELYMTSRDAQEWADIPKENKRLVFEDAGRLPWTPNEPLPIKPAALFLPARTTPKAISQNHTLLQRLYRRLLSELIVIFLFFFIHFLGIMLLFTLFFAQCIGIL